jgi:N-terminal half of MaoC dehydratase
MPMNPALEGKAYPPIPFLVTEEHVRRFAVAVGDDDSSVPPTFVTVPEIASGLARVIADAELGLDFSRVVHGDQEFEWSRPIRVGETLEVQTVIASIRSKGGTSFLSLRTLMRDAEGQIVVTAGSTMVERGVG